MRTEEIKRITRLPLFIIYIKGLIHRIFGTYEEGVKPHYIVELETRAEVAKDYYKELFWEETKPLHERLASLSSRSQGISDDNDEKQQDLTPIKMEHLERITAKIASYDATLNLHEKCIENGLELLKTTYLRGYLFRRKPCRREG